MADKMIIGNTGKNVYDPVNEVNNFVVTQEGAAQFTASIYCRLISENVYTTITLTPGTERAFNSSNIDNATLTIKPVAGYEIVSVKRVTTDLPSSASQCVYAFQAADYVASNDDRRKWVVTTKAAAPVVPTRDFAIGNRMVGAYDPVAEVTSYTCYQDGAETYNAKIQTQVYDPVSEMLVTNNTDLVGGVVKSVEIPSGASIKLICEAKEGFSFSSAKSASVSSIPFSAKTVEYMLASNALTNVNARRFEVKTVADVVPTKMAVGNTLTDGVVTQVGEARYSAKLEVITYDPVSETWSTKTTPLSLGVLTTVDFEKSTASIRRLVCEAVSGYKFNHASNGSIEIAFTDRTVSYELTTAEIDSASDLMRQYFITTVVDVPTPTPEPTVTNNYRLTKEELKKFQKGIFSSNVPDDPRKAASEFVSNTFIIPLIVPSSEVLLRENIKARDLTFNIADRLKGNTIHIEVGKISIPKVYDNTLDFEGVSVNLFLPFKSGDMNLDPYQVVGETIVLSYEINPTDGNTTVNISLENGELISTSTFKMGAEYPFYSFYDIQEKLYVPENVVNDMRTAYAQVKRPNYDNSPTPTVSGEGSLTGLTGFVSMSDVFELNGIPFKDEYDEVIRTLSNGVVIK